MILSKNIEGWVMYYLHDENQSILIFNTNFGIFGKINILVNLGARMKISHHLGSPGLLCLDDTMSGVDVFNLIILKYTVNSQYNAVSRVVSYPVVTGSLLSINTIIQYTME